MTKLTYAERLRLLELRKGPIADVDDIPARVMVGSGYATRIPVGLLQITPAGAQRADEVAAEQLQAHRERFEAHQARGVLGECHCESCQDYVTQRAMPPARAIAPQSGEFYWVRQMADGLPYIAQYQEENRDRYGAPAGPAFWTGVVEVVQAAGFEVLAHIPRPGRRPPPEPVGFVSVELLNITRETLDRISGEANVLRAEKAELLDKEERQTLCLIWVASGDFGIADCMKFAKRTLAGIHPLEDFKRIGPTWVVPSTWNNDNNHLETTMTVTTPTHIKLTPSEVSSGLTRQRWAELLIEQLPKDHDGRGGWLMNYGIGAEACILRQRRGLVMDSEFGAVALESGKPADTSLEPIDGAAAELDPDNLPDHVIEAGSQTLWNAIGHATHSEGTIQIGETRTVCAKVFKAMTDAGHRNTGRTSRQMQAAPHRALFVWCSESASYPIHLAADLGRTDLNIVTPYGLHRAFQNGRGGAPWPAVVVDHAAQLTREQEETVGRIRALAGAQEAQDERLAPGRDSRARSGGELVQPPQGAQPPGAGSPAAWVWSKDDYWSPVYQAVVESLARNATVHSLLNGLRDRGYYVATIEPPSAPPARAEE